MKFKSIQTPAIFALSAYLAVVGCNDAQWNTRNIPTAPALYQAQQPCPTNAEPRSYAAHCEQAAASKFARYAFQPHEGPVALELLAMATQCYRKSHETSLAEKSDQDRARWDRIISLDYQRLQLRLRHALLHSDKTDAAERARQLSRLLNSHPTSTYTTWLKALGRRLP